jgi:predicted PhzF superfamily epimerase YddE/YHI9
VPLLHVLRVFVGDDGRGGNPLGVFLRGKEIAESARQDTAARLGFSETVYVDDFDRGEVRIFTPGGELPFAGHPLVGSAWLLRQEGSETPLLRPPAGEIPLRAEPHAAYVAGRPEWSPPFEHEQLPSPEHVDALDGPPGDHDLVGAWSWLDEPAGLMRARVFAPRLGIAEDEATGSAAVILCARLGRPLVIHQGEGSIIHARPLDGGWVEIGGRVELDEMRDWTV